MKLVTISVHFEYAELIEAILDDHQAEHYFVFPETEGRDSEGFHDGSQVYPGTLTAIQVRVNDDRVDALLDALNVFRLEKKAHHHLEAVVVNIERWIGPPR